jgi:hypothetical protein
MIIAMNNDIVDLHSDYAPSARKEERKEKEEVNTTKNSV